MIHYGFDTLAAPRCTVVTIGSFDGVHSGHRVLLQHLKAMAQRLNAESVVVTFDPHPRIAMGRGEGMGLLTTIEERALLLEEAGIDHLVVARFDEEFRKQHYADFVAKSLVEGLGMVGMIVGYNHRLGRGSEGNYETLLPLAQSLGFEIECVSQQRIGEDKVSSTVVRNVMAEGDMARVASLLGGGYVVAGCADNGVLAVESKDKLLPPDGSYMVTIDGNAEPQRIVVEGRMIVLDGTISGDVIIRFK
jgi:riboflavin kinase/FMN adenylyltransferase